MTDTSGVGERLGARDLVVVGAGPVGIAALWYAGRYGIDAIALDAASSPLESVRRFSPGLAMASNALEWEIDGLPVDCRSVTEVTREDLLSYYARVSTLGRLRIATRQRVVALHPHDRGVRVVVRTENGCGYWDAHRVLVTSWFRTRHLDLSGFGVTVRSWIDDAASFLGEDVVIVGAGMSGLEAADLLIRSGVRVCLLSSRDRPLPPDLVRLVAISNSKVISSVERIRMSRPGVMEVAHDGMTTEVPCTVALKCAGQEVNPSVLEALRTGGFIHDDEVHALEVFRRATATDRRPLPSVAAQLPQLADALWSGRKGVHFAGTLFHVGGTRGAGIMYSIETAHWAVATIAGASVPGAPSPAAHLPSWFVEHTNDRTFPRRGPRWSAAFATIVPVPVPTWSRGTKLFEFETRDGRDGDAVSRATRALGDGRSDELTGLRDACYDGRTVAELLERAGLDRVQLVRRLRTLWFNNGLTWMPSAA